MSRRSIVLAAVVLVFSVAQARAEYTYKDLIGHRERWPAEVTLKADFKKRKTELKTGEKHKIFDVTRAGVLLDLGADKPPFPIPPDGCDIVEAANAKAAGGGEPAPLEPARPKRIDAETLFNDASLWPAKIKTIRPLSGIGADGQPVTLPAGSSFTVSNVDEQGVLGVVDDFGINLTLPIGDTDLVAAAQERAAIEPAKRSSRIIELFRDKLVDASGNKVNPATVDDATIFVFYVGANWCEQCHQLSPYVAKWVKANAAANPRMCVIMLNSDEKESEMLAYMTEGRMPWPAVRRDDWLKSFFSPMIIGALPQVTIMDRYGKVISSRNGGDPQSIQRHIAELQKVATGGAAK